MWVGVVTSTLLLRSTRKMNKLRQVCGVWSRVLVDLLAFCVLAALELGLYLAEKNGVVAERRGFFCDDTSIRLPFKHSTVPSWALVLASVCIPLVAIIVGHCMEQFLTKYKCPNSPFKPLGGAETSKCCVTVPSWVARMGFHLRWYFIGLLITLIITDTAKIVVGRLRPNFIDVCKPDFSQFNCTDVYNNPVYVTDYVCTGDPKMIPDTRYSWPSGHSSISSYVFIFVCFYIAGVRVFYYRSALKLALILGSFLLTLCTALSRITDHKHHPTDVLTGLILGGTIAAIVAYYNLYFFSHFNNQRTEPHPCAYNNSAANSDPQNYDRLGSTSPDHKQSTTTAPS